MLIEYLEREHELTIETYQYKDVSFTDGIDEICRKIKQYINLQYKYELTDNLITIYSHQDNEEIIDQYYFEGLKTLLKFYKVI